ADLAAILPADMGTDLIFRASPLQSPIAADEVMVTHHAEASPPVHGVNIRNCQVLIGVGGGIMDDNMRHVFHPHGHFLSYSRQAGSRPARTVRDIAVSLSLLDGYHLAGGG